MLSVSRNKNQNKNFFQINWSIFVYDCLKVKFLICGRGHTSRGHTSRGHTKRVNNLLLSFPVLAIDVC